jgi:RNA polymerase sigma factor (sigma-70 family)
LTGTGVGNPAELTEAQAAEALHALAVGGPETLRAFSKVYGGLIWSIARTYCPRPQDAEDAAQEALVRLWRSASMYDPARGSPAAFVIVVTRGAVLDYRKRMARAAEAHAAVAAGAAEPPRPVAVAATAPAAERVGLAERALADLPDEQREALTLSIRAGLSHDQISRSLSVPLGTVKSRIRLGLMALRGRLSAGSIAHGRAERTADTGGGA